ncbi:hypothetical protein KAZ93_00395 [Patescibacteria group bacterium]|nr:hypothetical protein [Patescibacteria group bacterium]
MPSRFIDLIAIFTGEIVWDDDVKFFDEDESLLETDVFHEVHIRITLCLECGIGDSSDTLMHIVDILRQVEIGVADEDLDRELEPIDESLVLFEDNERLIIITEIEIDAFDFDDRSESAIFEDDGVVLDLGDTKHCLGIEYRVRLLILLDL